MQTAKITLLQKQTTFLCLVYFLRFICFPFFLFTVCHRLIAKPFEGKYIFKKITFFSIITTGGTGGHLFPAIRFASHIIMKGEKIRFILNDKSLPLLKKLGYTHKNHFFYTEESCECTDAMKLIVLKIRPFAKNIKSLLVFTHAMLHSFYFFLTLGGLIQNVIGFGGYASFPTMFWALIFWKKIYIHEQNVVFGKVNALFLPFAEKVFTAFPTEKTQTNIYHTGMPFPRKIEQQSFIKKELKNSINILVISGSSGGSEAVKSILPAIINFAKKYKGEVMIYHQASGKFANEIAEKYTQHNINHTVSPFFENIHNLLPKIDLCISRSGASSIVDLLSCGVVTIFVPLQNSANNHQTKNASWVVQNNFGFLYKPWESNFYNLTALMYFALTANTRLNISKQSQTAIKRNARSLIFNHIW